MHNGAKEATQEQHRGKKTTKQKQSKKETNIQQHKHHQNQTPADLERESLHNPTAVMGRKQPRRRASTHGRDDSANQPRVGLAQPVAESGVSTPCQRSREFYSHPTPNQRRRHLPKRTPTGEGGRPAWIWRGRRAVMTARVVCKSSCARVSVFYFMNKRG